MLTVNDHKLLRVTRYSQVEDRTVKKSFSVFDGIKLEDIIKADLKREFDVSDDDLFTFLITTNYGYYYDCDEIIAYYIVR